MTLCVLDASVALAWAFEDETSAYAEKVIDAIQVHRAIVPPIWPLEVTNAMIGAVRRRRYQEADATRFLELLNTIQLDVDPEIARGSLGRRILLLGRSYGVTAYDASYLELAVRLALPLATLDDRLIRATADVGIRVFQP